MNQFTLPVSVLLTVHLAACVPLATLSEPPPAPPSVRQASVHAQWVGEHWQEAAVGAATEHAGLLQWWQRYDDATLNELIRLALQQAPDIRDAQLRLQQARAARALAEAALLPALALSGNLSRRHAQDNTEHAYGAALEASWESSLFGGHRDLAAAAQADAASSALQLAATRVLLAAEVAREYVTLRSLQQRLIISSENLRHQEQSVQLVAWREQAGLASALDLAQARTNLASSQANLPALRSAAAASRQRLALVTGQTPAAVVQQLSKAAPLPQAAAFIAPDIPARSLQQRADVQAAHLAMEAEWQRLAAQRSERWPGVTLRGSLAWQAAQLAALGGAQSALQTLAAGLSLPLFDGGRIDARIAQQSASLAQAELRYMRSVLTALTETEAALAEQEASHARLLARQDAATAAARAVQLARNMYASGLIDFQKLLESERSQLSAAEALVSAQAEVLHNQIQFYKVLGGGWQASAQSDEQADELTDELVGSASQR